MKTMTVREAVDKGLVKRGDRVVTEAGGGNWTGGPCIVTRVGAEDPEAPEIPLYVRHADGDSGRVFGDRGAMGCFESETLEIRDA